MARTKGSKNTSQIIESAVIYIKALHNGEYSGEQVRQYLVKHKEDLGLKKNDIVPKRRKIERIIRDNPEAIEEAKTRIKANKSEGVDRPWSLGAYEKSNINPEVVPYLLLIQDYVEKYPDMFNNPQTPLTIRQAKWVGRLYGIVKARGFNFKEPGFSLKPKGKDKLSAAAFLYDWSKVYATYEIICEISGSDNSAIDTAKIDEAIRSSSRPVVVGSQYILLHNDNSFSVDPITLKQLKKEDGESK